MPETAETTPAPEFFAELAAAQAEFAPVRKNRTNPATRSQYADLQSVLDAVKPALNRHGFFLFQRVTCSGDAVGVETFLGRGAEQLSSGVFAVPFASLQNRGTNAAQALGSARTYACRYSLCSFLCVAADDDDDGNGTFTPAPAVAAVSDALAASARTAAQGGTDQFREFWKALPPNDKAALTNAKMIPSLQNIAKQADAQATS